MSRRKQSNPKPLKWDDECVNEAEDGDGRGERKVGSGIEDDPNSNPESGKDVGESGSSYPTETSPSKQMDCTTPSSRKRRDLMMASGGGLDYPVSRHHHRQDKKEGNVSSWQKSPNSHRKYTQGMILQQPNSIDSRTSPEMDTEDEQPLPLHLYHGTTIERRKSDGRRSETPEMPNDLNGSGPFSHQRIIQAGLPYLHLLPPAIRNDAARLFFMPPILPPELAAAAAATGQTQPLTSTNAKNEKVTAGLGERENCRSGPVYMCEPCNIKFSSTRTLEAHQTYYCSFRKDTGKDDKNDLDSDNKSEGTRESGSGGNSGNKKRERVSSGEDRSELSLDELRQEGLLVDGGTLNVSKSVKTGKLYACIYCSYSADKKVSLNRHMRMHSGPPSSSTPNNGNTTTTTSLGNNPSAALMDDSMNSLIREDGGKTDGANALERYCQDCDIQFSSIKTFRVHKQYYCSTRHVLKAQQLAAAAAAATVSTGSSSSSNSQKQSSMDLGGGGGGVESHHHRVINTNNSPIPPSNVSPIPPGTPLSSQPFVVLPTNPVIIVPYCFIQGASILPSNVLPTQNALVVLPNGSVQCLPATNACPSPQSMASLVMSLQHSSANSSNPNSSTNLASVTGGGASLSPVFNDPKEMIRDIRKICGGGNGGIISSNSMTNVSRNSSDESSNEPHSHSQSGGGGMCGNLGGGGCSINGSGQDINSDVVAVVEPSTTTSHRHRQGGEHDSQPAIDLTLRSTIKREPHGGDDEKENLGMIYSTGQLQSDVMSRELMNNSPSERLSVGSGSGSEKRTHRPSSASISSSCSTPPALCEPKLNGILSRVSPGPIPLGRNHHHGSGSKKSSFLHHGSGNKGIDYSVLEMREMSSKLRSISGSTTTTTTITNPGNGSSDKISPIATHQLPGGAILTSASNQSLAELLLSNPPELNESLAKLNPQLLINSRSSGFNPTLMNALTPELALRFLDPTYLATLQHSLQQQQLQQQQTQSQQATPPSVKRGVSKCIECDIVFYKFENYLVHKEHYCAARLTNPSGGMTPNSGKNSKENSTNNHGAKESASSSCSSPKSELDDGVSPPPSILNCSSVIGNRKNSTRSSISSNVSLLRRSPDDCTEDSKHSLRGKAKSPCSLTVSPIASPSSIKSEKLGAVTTQQLVKNSVEGQSERYPCTKCGIQYSSLDTLQTHQTFYCRKRGGTELSSSNSCPDGEQRGKGERGFIKCPKCRLAVPDDQMNLHSQVCSGGRNGSSGSISTTTMGWKCPCCDTYSPTMSAAQKHLETHTGIRAFKCLLCGYRGNTLRGMRTHIRMHFDKRVSDLQEGDYIACITANSEMESQTTQSNSAPLLIHYPQTSSSAPTPELSPTNNNTKVISSSSQSSNLVEPHVVVAGGNKNIPPLISPGSTVISSNEVGNHKGIKSTCPPPPPSSISPPSSTSMMETTDDENKGSKLETNSRLHFCTLCNYSSSYKGNVVRHMKLVHKISEESADEIVSASSGSSSREQDYHHETNSHDSFTKDVECSGLDKNPSSPSSSEYDRNVKTNSSSTTTTTPSAKLPINGVASGESQNTGMEEGVQERHRSSSRSSSEEDLTSNHSKKEESCGVQYCKSCNIYFNYPATFVAHKKFYCSSHVSSDTETVERAETPVQ